MSMEIQHLLRVLTSPNTIAKDFAGYCKRNQVVTRGLCKIGYVTRKPPPEAKPQSGAGYLPPMDASQLRLRGLIANKDIKKDENVVMMAERACLHPGRALRCDSFMRLLPEDIRKQHLEHPKLLQNERLTEGSLIRYHQLLIALYMTYITMGYRLKPDWAASQIPGSDIIQYFDFLPRTEGDFRALSLHLSRWLDNASVVRECEGALAQQFSVTQAEVRALLLYSLCMVFSRMVPVDHKGILQASFRNTPLADSVSSTSASGSSGTGEDNNTVGAVVPLEESSEFVKEPLSFLCPIIDMCNHSTSENVAVMVPSAAPGSAFNPSSGPVICLRTLRDVRQGEELTMSYGSSPNEMKVVWGMQHILE